MWWDLIWPLLWPSLASISVALVAWMLMRGRGSFAAQGVRGRTALAAGAAVVVIMAYPLYSVLPLWIDAPMRAWTAVGNLTYALPLVLGLIVIVVLGLPREGHRGAPAGAHLAPRTWRSFLATWWLGAALTVLAVILGITLAAGLASDPDEDGDYTRYVIDLGSSGAEAGIYGWHHSAPPLVLLVLLILVTWWALTSIARPPLRPDPDGDTASRRLRSTNVLRVALGALLLHLGSILSSLANTASLVITTHAADGIYFTTGTPFSALRSALLYSSYLVDVVGLGLLVFTALTALPSAPRHERPSERPSERSSRLP